MNGTLILLALMFLVFIVYILSRREILDKDEKRSRELLEEAKSSWPTLDTVQALDLLYRRIYKQMLEVRSWGGDYDALFTDTILIWNLRNEAIANEAESEVSYRNLKILSGRESQ